MLVSEGIGQQIALQSSLPPQGFFNWRERQDLLQYLVEGKPIRPDLGHGRMEMSDVVHFTDEE
jgi:hypothetical protein